MGKSSVRKRDYLYPATQLTGSPMRLDEFVAKGSRQVLVDGDRLNPAYVTWHNRMVAKGKTRDETKTYTRKVKD